MKKRVFIYVLIGIVILSFPIMFILGTTFFKKMYVAKKLESKYQEKFKIVSYEGWNIFDNYYSVKAYSENYPNLKFIASVGMKSGNVTDSYVSKRLCDRVSKEISNNLKTLNDDYYVFTEAALEDTLFTNPMISMEEYLDEMKGQKFSIHLCIDKNNSSAQNIVSSINNMMAGLPEFNGVVYLYFTDSNLLAQIEKYVKSSDKVYSSFDKMTNDNYIGYIEFFNSHVALTEFTLNKMMDSYNY